MAATDSARLVKHPLPQRVMHWFNAACFLLLWLTGIGIVTTSGYRIAPQFYVDLLQGIFGSGAALLGFHVKVGMLWFGVMAVGFVVDPYGLAWRFLRDLVPTRADLDWLLLRPKAELDPSVELPPQGAYNGGQKAFGATALVGGTLIGLTGVAMVVGSGGELGRWVVLLHLLAVGGVIAFFFVHFSMAALIKVERPALKSMFTGQVDPEYASHHHGDWYEAHKRAGGEHIRAEHRFGLPRAVGRGLLRVGRWLASATRQPEWNPYVAGIGLGLTVVAAFAVWGHGLGASGVMSRLGAFGVAAVAPDHVASNSYWASALDAGLADYWLLWLLGGAALGGFVSAALSGRLESGMDRGALVSPGMRITLALVGGALVGFATRFTRGCTSHQALSGGAMLSLGAWVFMLSVFAGGFGAAFFLRRIWR